MMTRDPPPSPSQPPSQPQPPPTPTTPSAIPKKDRPFYSRVPEADPVSEPVLMNNSATDYTVEHIGKHGSLMMTSQRLLFEGL